MKVKEANEETKEEKWVWKESREVCLTVRTKELPPSRIFLQYEELKFLPLLQQYDNVTTVRNLAS
jgi:hypothetical protein